MGAAVIVLLIAGIIAVTCPEHATKNAKRKRTPLWKEVEYDDQDIENTIMYGKWMIVGASIIIVLMIISKLFGLSE